MSLWEQYNAQEDGDTDEMSYRLLNEAHPDDPRSEQYEKENDIQKYACSIQRWLMWLDFDNGQFQEFIKKSPTIDLDYCKSRYAEGTSVLLKWHYCIALFFTENHDWLKKAIPLILRSAHKSHDRANAVFYLTLAFNLNKLYTCGQDEDVKETAICFVRRQSSPLLDICVRIIDVLEKSSKIRNEIRDTIIDLSSNQKEPGVLEAYLKSAIGIARGIDKNPIRAKLAQHYERYGDEQSEPLARIIYYKKAQDCLPDGDDKKIIGNRIQSTSKDIGFSEITHEMKIPKLDIRGESNFEKLRFLIGLFKCHMANVEKIKQDTKKLQHEFPLASLFSHVQFGDAGMPTAYSNTKEQIDHAEYVQNFQLHINYFASVFSVSVLDYEKDGRITIEDHLKYLRTIELHDESVMRLIEHGITKHYDKDYISSIHILIPQIEYTLRKLLEQKGISTVAFKNNIMDYEALYGLIRRSSQILGSDFTEFLKLKLVDKNSINLRNRVCHSIYEEFENLENYNALHDFTHATSLSLILIIALLTSLSV